jgi:hypothetical protein
MNVKKSFSPFTMRQRHSVLKAGLIVLLSVSMLPAAHAAISCAGKVTELAIDSGGQVLVAMGGSTPLHIICSTVTQGSYTINPQACRIAYAGLLTAQTSDRTAKIYYNGLTSCGQIAGWTAQPGAYFVENY